MSKNTANSRLKAFREWAGFNEKWERAFEPEWAKGHKKVVKEEKKDEKKEKTEDEK